MELFRYQSLALLCAVSGCRVLCGLAVAKALSILGPDQFGTVSQIIGISAVFYGFTGGVLTNGLIVIVGRETDPVLRRRWLATSLVLGVGTGALLAAVAIVLYRFGGNSLFGNENLSPVFLGIAAAQAITGLGNVFLSYASGTRDLTSFSISNILGNLAWMVITVAVTIWGGFDSAIWAVTFAPSCTAIVIIWLYRREIGPAVRFMFDVRRADVIMLLRTSGLMVISICAVPLAHSILRSNLSAELGWHQVGLWQSIVRLSDAYMQFFALIIINFVLPKVLSRANEAERSQETIKLGGLLIGMFLLMAAGLYIFGDQVIRLAFSPEFLPASGYVVPQLVGDFAKLAAWIIVYRFVAATHFWVHPAAEVFQANTLVLFYLLLLPTLKGAAPVYGHLCSTLALLTVLGGLAFSFRRHFVRRLPESPMDDLKATIP